MAQFQVVEKFVSINGEARRAGELAVFIRFKGCNLHCAYCDTKWANQKDAPFTIMTEDEIYDYIHETGVRNVTLTGGEPLLREHMDELLEKLLSDPFLRVEIETNGSVDLTPFAKMKQRPSFTMDYKLGYSGMEAKMCLSNFSLLTKEDTVKFVVGSVSDMEKAVKVIDKYQLLNRVAIYFSPVFGAIEPEVMVNFLVEHKLNDVRMQLQLHKFIWNPEKKGV
jgi:7-carboxy-7-deazaguanine synthase